MQLRALLTVLVLAVAILSFGGLAYQTVPISTLQTITEESTQTSNSYSLYSMTTASMYAYTIVAPSTFYGVPAVPSWINCVYGQVCGYITYIEYLQSSYVVQVTATIPYSQTSFNTVTMSSTNIVPAYATLGFTDATFGLFSIIVIGVLAFIVIWGSLKITNHQKPKQAKMSKFIPTKPLCVKCGAELPPASEFCNKCGTRQP